MHMVSRDINEKGKDFIFYNKPYMPSAGLHRLGKFTSISGRQRKKHFQNLVVHKHLWSSSSVFLLQNSRKIGKIWIF